MEDYRGKIFEGMWVHRTKEESKSLEVIGCDYHRGVVTLVDGTTMEMDSFYKNYMFPRLEGMDIGDFERQAILGGLSKESNEPRKTKETPKTAYKDEVEVVIDNADESDASEVIPKQPIENELTAEQRMLFDSINLTKGDETTVNENVSIVFDFDISKIIKMSKMFDISSDDVVKVILETESGADVIKNILKAIVESLSKE